MPGLLFSNKKTTYMKEPEKRERINVVGKLATEQKKVQGDFIWTHKGESIPMQDMSEEDLKKAYKGLAKKAIKYAAALNKMQTVLQQLDHVATKKGMTLQLDVV